MDAKTVKAENGERVAKHVLITRYDPVRAARGEMISIEDILEILATPLPEPSLVAAGQAAIAVSAITVRTE